jgi:hypothetical protein
MLFVRGGSLAKGEKVAGDFYGRPLNIVDIIESTGVVQEKLEVLNLDLEAI